MSERSRASAFPSLKAHNQSSRGRATKPTFTSLAALPANSESFSELGIPNHNHLLRTHHISLYRFPPSSAEAHDATRFVLFQPGPRSCCDYFGVSSVGRGQSRGLIL